MTPVIMQKDKSHPAMKATIPMEGGGRSTPIYTCIGW